MRNKMLLLAFLQLIFSNTIMADSTIDGNGNKLTLTETGSLTVPTGAKLTLKDLTVVGIKGTRLTMEDDTSRLVLQNSKLMLEDSYSFSQGSIEVIGNSEIGGEYTFTFSGHNLLIDNGAKLTIGSRTSFVLTPSFGMRHVIRMADDTSTFALDGGTLNCNTVSSTGDAIHGTLFTNGRLEIEGASTLDCLGTLTDKSLVLGSGPTFRGDSRIIIKPHARLTVKDAGIVYRNNGPNGFNTSGNLGTIKSESNGRFVVANQGTPISSLGMDGFAGASIMGTQQVSLGNDNLDFDVNTLSGLEGVSTLTSMQGAMTTTGGGSALSVHWNPNNEILAISTAVQTGAEVYFYRFAGGTGPSIESHTALTPLTVAGASLDFDVTVSQVKWSPDGKKFAIAKSTGGNDFDELIVYSFTDNVPTSARLYGVNYAGASATTCDWSPCGRYLAAGKDDFANGETESDSFIVYKFDPSVTASLTKVDGVSMEGTVNEVEWSPDGRFIAIATNNLSAGSDQTEFRIYSFDETELTLIGSVEAGAHCYSVSWSPDGYYIALGSAVSASEVNVYRFDSGGNNTNAEVLTSVAVDNITTVTSVRWSPDGMNLAAAYDTDTRLYSFSSAEGISTVVPNLVEQGKMNGLAWTSDGEYLVSANVPTAAPTVGLGSLSLYRKAGNIGITSILEITGEKGSTGAVVNIKQNMELKDITFRAK